MNAVLLAVWRPAAAILLAGLIRFLTDYQSTGKFVPSLVDGALVAADAGAGVVGLPIAWTGVKGMIAQARTQPAAPPPGGLKPQ